MNRILMCLFVILTSCCINQNQSIETVTIMSWNVQNLFDGIDNGYEYDEFSVSDGLWSEYLYKIRLKNIVKIIELNNPDIIGLQEIEGLVVLEDIQKILPKYKYIISSNNPGAIQTGFLSLYPIVKTGIITPYYPGVRLRSLLEITVEIGDDKLIIINNHWKSKSGGFSESLRISSGKALKKRFLELDSEEVLALGDFNENYNEYQLIHKSYETGLMYKTKGEGLYLDDGNVGDSELYTPWPNSVFKGSYKYKDRWETIDNFFLNKKLLDKEIFSYSDFYVDNRDILLTKSGEVKKWITDFSTGYSDHLPIVLILKKSVMKTTLE